MDSSLSLDLPIQYQVRKVSSNNIDMGLLNFKLSRTTENNSDNSIHVGNILGDGFYLLK
jgi:hypothetical protein